MWGGRFLMTLQWACFFVLFVLPEPPPLPIIAFAWVCGAAAMAQFHDRAAGGGLRRRMQREGRLRLVWSRYAAKSARQTDRLQKLDAGVLPEAEAAQLREVLGNEEHRWEKRMDALLAELPPEAPVARGPWAPVLEAVCAFLGAPDVWAPECRLRSATATCPSETALKCHICEDLVGQGAAVAVVQPCNHLLHEPCWLAWSLMSLRCPVCGQVETMRDSWQAKLVAGEWRAAVALLRETHRPFYTTYLPLIRTRRWAWTMRLYWATARCRDVLGAPIGVAYLTSLTVLLWWYAGLYAAARPLVLYAAVAMVNAALVALFWTPWCRGPEPDLHRTMVALRDEVWGDPPQPPRPPTATDEAGDSELPEDEWAKKMD